MCIDMYIQLYFLCKSASLFALTFLPCIYLILCLYFLMPIYMHIYIYIYISIINNGFYTYMYIIVLVLFTIHHDFF